LGKGLNYAVSPAVLPIEDILTDVNKATVSLPVEAEEEVRHENVCILKASGRPRDNLSGAESSPGRQGNVTVVLNTKDYNEKILALLRASTYRRLPKDPTEAVQWKTTILLKKSSLPEEVVQQLWPQGSTPPRLYGLPKIHKEKVPQRPIVSTIRAPTYCLAQHLA
jgi:hypothetical protein